MGVKLYMFSGSHPVRMAELMLEHKRIEYRRVNMLPGTHAFQMLLRGFETMTVPALDIDGRRVQGTREISRVLDELVPERPLFPADPERRRAVQDAERWGEELQDAIRRVFYCLARRDPRAFASITAAGRPLPSRLAVRAMRPAVVRLAGAYHRATEASGQAELATLPERLDRIDAWIEEGLLGGEQLNAADFQIGVCMSALLLSQDVAPLIGDRPAAALGRRVAPDYPGAVAAVAPPEWLAALRAAAASAASRDRVELGPHAMHNATRLPADAGV